MAIKVLIVDDSTFFRKRLTEIIKADPSLEVIGEAKDGKDGVEKTISLKPDVVTMDVEMPVLDGISAVKEIMSKCPTPILMFSSLTFEGANSTFKALEAGAVDFMPKNFDDIAHKRESALDELRASIKAVARSHIRRTPSSSSLASSRASTTVGAGTSSLGASRPGLSSTTTPARTSTFGARSSTTSTLGARTSTLGSTTSSLTGTTASSTIRPGTTLSSRPATATLTSASLSTQTSAAPASTASSTSVSSGARQSFDKIYDSISSVNQGRPAAAMHFEFGAARGVSTNFKVSGKSHELIAIGSSTGGPIALQNIIPKLPRLNVPIVIVQHMPASFTTTFAQRLNNLSQNEVVEAEEGMILEPGHCYIAPGGKQMIFERGAGKTKIRILPADPRVVYHPCVDVTFASLSNIYSSSLLAMILTGMGSDGCEGCRLLRKNGSVIWAQNEDTCVVYGMPQAIVNAGIADQILPLEKIADCIVQEMRA